MCKSCGRCVAITMIVFGVLILISGILTLVAPIILDCDKFDDWIPDYKDDRDDDLKEFCDQFVDIATTAGAVVTAIGGVLIIVGILMLCCLRSKRPKIVQAAPVIATVQPGYGPYQYQNPLMQQGGYAQGGQEPPKSGPMYPDLSKYTQHS